MAADDDPEQRIRDLERSLSDRASELGVGPADAPVPTYIPPRDAYPPPPPGASTYSSYSSYPPSPAAGAYGPSYPPPPAYSNMPLNFGTPIRSSSSNGFRWLFFLIPLVGIVIAGFSVFAFYQAADDVTSQFSSIQSAVPSIGFPAPSNGGAAPTVTQGGTVSVSGVSKRETVACDGGSVNVSGISNTVEITGHCATVIVSGVENQVKVETSDSITASGVTNHVTYSSGSPKTSAIGDNVIEKG